MTRDYKDTLNLPKTDFSMKANLPQREPLFLKRWQEINIYKLISEKSKNHPKYILHDGPPYANGDIHIGHALNKTLKDIIIKYKTMQGFNTPFVPGWDCHGLPVEHQLFKELGINKYQISRVEFRKKAQAYALKYVSIQREQFIRLGVFGDWFKPYLTLDKEYEEVILWAFAQLVKKGYVYHGTKPVNWCYVCETALAEAEVEYNDYSSDSIYVKFEIIDFAERLKKIPEGKKVYAIVWTTTPWTLIANVAIALNPDFRYALLEVDNEFWLLQEDLVSSLTKKLGVKNYKIINYFLGKDLENLSYRDIFSRAKRHNLKFVLADYVSKEEGTGLVHTAPGHGQEDYLTGQKYNLETIMPVDKKGIFFQDVAVEFKGQHVFVANEGIIEKLRRQGNLLLAEKITHAYPHCWRCKTPIIFRATPQWFIGMDRFNLRKRLLEAVEEVNWIPASGKERILAMINLRPDWCISRQRYWGVPIPSIYCTQCGNEFLEEKVIDEFIKMVAKEGTDIWFTQPELFLKEISCPACGGKDLKIGEDILDVWFDSGVSHQAVLKKREELEYPSALYLEGSDQHRGWFQSSLIPAICLDEKPPFREVLTHGFVVDSEGRKMSKSLGNVISPQEIIKDYGADILRLWVASSDYNEDIRISFSLLSRIAEAYRKIRNTARFILSNLYDFDPQVHKCSYEDLKKIDKWILFRLSKMLQKVTEVYEKFIFYKAYQEIYDFCNKELSMYYLDMIKGRLYTYYANSLERRCAQTVLYETINVLVKIIAPILVFTAEEIWQYLPKEKTEAHLLSVHLCDWPKLNPLYVKEDMDKELKVVMDLILEINPVLEEKRSCGLIGSSFDAQINILTKDQFRYKYLESLKDELPEIFKVSQVNLKKETPSSSCVISKNYPEIGFFVLKAEGQKCPRCWNYSPALKKDKEGGLLCPRCLKAIGQKPN